MAGKLERHEFIMGKMAAVGKIVDREYRARRIRLHGKQGRHQPGLPVVAVYHVGSPSAFENVHREHGRRSRKHCVTFGVVRPVVTVGMQVGVAGTVEELGTVDDPQTQTEAGMGRGEDAHIVCASRPLHSEPAGDLDIIELRKNIPVARQQHAHVEAEPAERMRQAVDDISEAAGLQQRVGFACCKEDIHQEDFRTSAASGGNVISIECSNPIQGTSCTGISPPLPLLVPP